MGDKIQFCTGCGDVVAENAQGVAAETCRNCGGPDPRADLPRQFTVIRDEAALQLERAAARRNAERQVLGDRLDLDRAQRAAAIEAAARQPPVVLPIVVRLSTGDAPTIRPAADAPELPAYPPPAPQQFTVIRDPLPVAETDSEDEDETCEACGEALDDCACDHCRECGLRIPNCACPRCDHCEERLPNCGCERCVVCNSRVSLCECPRCIVCGTLRSVGCDHVSALPPTNDTETSEDEDEVEDDDTNVDFDEDESDEEDS